MGHRSEVATPDNSDEESGDAFTDGDFGDSDDETIIERHDEAKPSHIPINETVNENLQKNAATNGHSNGNDVEEQPRLNGRKDSENQSSDVESQSLVLSDLRRDSHGDQNPSIVGILGDQQNHVRIANRLVLTLITFFEFCIVSCYIRNYFPLPKTIRRWVTTICLGFPSLYLPYERTCVVI